MTEYEEDDPVGARDPRRVFMELAVRAGVVPSLHDGISDALWSYTMAVVCVCADVGDAYGETTDGGNAGEHIRAALLD